MKRSTIVLVLFFVCGFVMTANAQTVTGSIAGGSVARGKAARASVVLNIPGGLHVNSSRPSSEFAIPTVVTVRGNGVRVSSVTYPRGRNRKFQFSENTINVYEGRVNFPFTVTVPENFRGNSIRVTATVRYQACTDEVCYPPKTKTVVMNARVKQ
jgi:DsbC/DsbD-like thiol-disulfide interchange protein